jgi:hypothetical protein
MHATQNQPGSLERPDGITDAQWAQMQAWWTYDVPAEISAQKRTRKPTFPATCLSCSAGRHVTNTHATPLNDAHYNRYDDNAGWPVTVWRKCHAEKDQRRFLFLDRQTCIDAAHEAAIAAMRLAEWEQRRREKHLDRLRRHGKRAKLVREFKHYPHMRPGVRLYLWRKETYLRLAACGPLTDELLSTIQNVMREISTTNPTDVPWYPVDYREEGTPPEMVRFYEVRTWRR